MVFLSLYILISEFFFFFYLQVLDIFLNEAYEKERVLKVLHFKIPNKDVKTKKKLEISIN